MIPVFKNLRMLGKGLRLKTTALLVFFLWLEKSLIYLQKIGLLIAQIIDLLTVVSDRIARS